jgi:YVTN family beta-propeller protein
MQGRRWLAAVAAVTYALALASPVRAGQTVYAAEVGANRVVVLDAATAAPDGAAIPVGSGPLGVAVASDGARVYVSNRSSNTVSVIDAATRSVVATIPVGSLPYGVALSPDDSRLYVANQGSNTMSVIDTASETVVATVGTTGSAPSGVAVAPDGARVYVVNQFGNTVDVVAAAINTIIDTIAVGGSPLDPSFTPDGSRLLVSTQSGGLQAIDPATDTVVATIPPAFGVSVAANRDGTVAYYAATSGGPTLGITALSLPSLTPMHTTPVTDNPIGKALTADGSRLFFGGNLGTWLMDTSSGGSVTQLGTAPSYALAVSPAQLAPAFTASTEGSRARLDASSSIATDGVGEYRWDFGDGATETTSSPVVEHDYGAAGTHTVRLTLRGADGCESDVFTGQTATCRVEPPAQRSIAVGAPRAPAAAPGTAAAPMPAPCDRAIVLTDVLWHDGKVSVVGVADARYAGQPVAIVRGERVVGHATVVGDGSFRATLTLARRGPRIQAAVAGRRSSAMKVTRQLRLTGRRALADGSVRVTGRTPSGGGSVAVRAQSGCTPSASRTVRTIHADHSGRFAVTFPAPTSPGDVAVYRLASRRPLSYSLPVVLSATP